ncbi:MAG: hypothetical protein BJ554DRAFT_1275 [Olpidium bornovanus]|uniref:WD repeat-containing protein JIP5 n=1 Tax=Olpidium bornovanus TaxID=278681 RepID=A0A8H8DLY2_9FUNG|nr:MAG: hypothetical protein BJ554DRAFT_1275 [Olpidium bornovanus]
MFSFAFVARPSVRFAGMGHTDGPGDGRVQGERGLYQRHDVFRAVEDAAGDEPIAISECQEDELLSVVVLKVGREVVVTKSKRRINGKKVAVGTQGGVVHIFNFGSWGDCTDRFVGHPNSIDTMVKATEDVSITGSSDGMIRGCQIQPNTFLGVVGEHEEFPVEQIRLSHDKAFLASCSHDETVGLWSMEAMLGAIESEDDEEGDAEGESEDMGDGAVAMDIDDSDDEPASRTKTKKRRRKGKGNKVAAASFFADL